MNTTEPNAPSNEPVGVSSIKNLPLREILIIILLTALCLAMWQCDHNKGKLNDQQAADIRHQRISSVLAARGAMRDRETNVYPVIDKGITEIDSKRAGIKAEERTIKPRTRKDVENETKDQTKGDINALARLLVQSGYSCAVR